MAPPSTTSATPVDPNRPSNLSILPSTNSTLQLRRATRKERSTNDPTRVVNETDEEDNEEEEEVQHEQDIETYGIAGRTWEAAYLMKRYFKPPYTSTTTTSSTSNPKLVFEPPCPLFVPNPLIVEQDFSSSSSPPRPQRTKRKRTVVEIGSGTGYLSLHLLPYLQESHRLIVTDLPEVCPLLRTNLGLSLVDEEADVDHKRPHTSLVPFTVGEVRVRPLPWGDEVAFKKLADEFGLSSSDEMDSDPSPSSRLGPDLILASDLVYFPFLYPGLLRTLIWLTQPRPHAHKPNADDKPRKEVDVPPLVIGYKIRSLPREEPFWKAFGIWFEFEPVYYRPIPTTTQDPTLTSASASTVAAAADEEEDDWHRFGETSQGQDQLYIFVCTRRPKTYDWEVPKEDEMLMNGFGSDDQFETLLLLGIEC